MKTIRIDYCGMDGEGRTVKEAKADAARKLAALVKRSNQAPELIAFRGALVRDPARAAWQAEGRPGAVLFADDVASALVAAGRAVRDGADRLVPA